MFYTKSISVNFNKRDKYKRIVGKAPLKPEILILDNQAWHGIIRNTKKSKKYKIDQFTLTKNI